MKETGFFSSRCAASWLSCPGQGKGLCFLLMGCVVFVSHHPGHAKGKLFAMPHVSVSLFKAWYIFPSVTHTKAESYNMERRFE